MPNIEINEANFDIITDVHNEIPEFSQLEAADFKNRCLENNTLGLVCCYKKKKAGYAVCYDRYKDGSIYIWMVGVRPEFRQKGLYSSLFAYIVDWALENGYVEVKIKTRNRFKEMLHWLIKNDFEIEGFQQREPLSDSRIQLRKMIEEK